MSCLKSPINLITNPNPVYSHNHVTAGVRSGISGYDGRKMSDFESLVAVIQRLEAQAAASQSKTDANLKEMKTNQKRLETKTEANSEKFEVL
jgi:hypothetical protein